MNEFIKYIEELGFVKGILHGKFIRWRKFNSDAKLEYKIDIYSDGDWDFYDGYHWIDEIYTNYNLEPLKKMFKSEIREKKLNQLLNERI